MMPGLELHLLQSTVFACAAGVLTLLLRGNRARPRYWIWLAASMKFLIPFSLLVEIGHRLSWRGAPVVTQPEVVYAIDQFTQPFGTQPHGVVSVTAASAGVSFPDLLFAVWMLGCLCVLIFRLSQWIRVAVLLRASWPVSEGREFQCLRRMDAQLRLISSATGIEPGVFGIFRPVLSLPEGIGEHLDNTQLEAIFAHELCHVRQRDNLTAALHMIVEAVFWFHPLVWWMGSRLVEERERACDEAVVRMGSDPEAYAASILKICRLYLAPPLPCAAGISGADLVKRIENIMKDRLGGGLSFGKKVVLGVALALAIAGPVGVGVLGARIVRAQLAMPAIVTPRVPDFVGSAPASRNVIAQAVSPPAQSAPRPAAAAPQPAARVEFEAAAIRPVGAGAGRGPMTGGPGTDDPDRFTWEKASLRSLVMKGWGLQVRQVFGPDWIDSEKYTISVVAAPGTSQERFLAMLRNLLTDRFRMTLHSETRESDAWELVVAKGGLKVKDASLAANAAARYAPQVLNFMSLPVDRDGFLQMGNMKGWAERMANGNVFETFQSVTMADLAQRLALRMGVNVGPNRFASALVVDRTGLAGEYDFTLEYALKSAPMPRFNGGVAEGDAADPEGPDFFQALEKQDGLRLQKAKVPEEVVVIDRADRVPAEN